MKVLIVGAAGFIGSTTAAYLIKHTDFSVVSVDDLSTTEDVYSLEPARRANSRHQFYIADASDANIVEKILRVERPDLLLFAIEMNDAGVKIVQLFNRLVQKNGLALVKTIVVVSHPTQTGDYEKMDALPTFDLPNHIVVATCRVFGPRQHSRHFLPSVIYSALNLSTKIPIINNSSPQEWLYIGEFFKALLAIIDSKTNSPSYCISSGYVATEAEIANKIFQIVGAPIVPGESSSITSKTLDVTEIAGLGWRATLDLGKSLEHTAKWFSDNTWAHR